MTALDLGDRLHLAVRKMEAVAELVSDAGADAAELAEALDASKLAGVAEALAGAATLAVEAGELLAEVAAGTGSKGIGRVLAKLGRAAAMIETQRAELAAMGAP